ncbi:MAG: NUDIX domain-containing protein [Rhizobiales bacterium]|nr:NUDIX domain-containing protein [Hyphomicrobiales bacterium]
MVTDDPRAYPRRPFLAVSAAIFRAGQVLLVKRTRPPVTGVYTLPGGVVEIGETLHEAVVREVMEETSMEVMPIALAGYRNVVIRDADGKVERHFVVLPFAARWIAGEFCPSEELAEGFWMNPREIAGLKATEGLPDIIATAFRLARTGATAAAAP